MSEDNDKEESSAKDNASDDSSVFSELEPPPAHEEGEEAPETIPNPPEPKDSPMDEEKEEIVENEQGESSMNDDHNIAKMEDLEDVEEGKISPETPEVVPKEPEEETPEQVGIEPSSLVHIGSTRGETKTANATTTEPTTRNNRTLMIAGLCLCLFVIVIVQAVTLGLVLNNKSNDKGIADVGPPRIPTLRPTTRMPTVSPTSVNGFASIANEPGVLRLNQVSFCDECTEYVLVPTWENYLPWDAWTYVTELEVNSNGFVTVYCWNAGQCGMIDVVALNLSPNVKGSIYMLWEQDDSITSLQEEDPPATSAQAAADGVDARQRLPQGRTSTLTISFEEVMVFGYFDSNGPYQVNAQVKISQDGIIICYGAGNIEYNAMRSGFYNYTDNYNYVPATGGPFDRNGYATTFPEGTCQSLSSANSGWDFVPTESPTFYWRTNTPTDRWSGWYPTHSPTDWYYRPTERPSDYYYWYPTPSPMDWYYRPTPRPTYGYYYPTPRPSWYYYTAPPTFGHWGTRWPTPTDTYSPTWSPTFAYNAGFEYLFSNPDARPLEIVSNCDECVESTRFPSFPYRFRGRDNIWEIAVSSNGYLELVGDCGARGGFATCAVINVAAADLVPSASISGNTIWTMETEESYIYSFEYVPLRNAWSSPFDVEDEEEKEGDDATWMMDDDSLLNRHLQYYVDIGQDVTYGNVSAQVHLYFDGQIDICWGELYMSEYNSTFTSSIVDFVADEMIPANGYYFDEVGSVIPYRYPFFTCQTLLQSDTGPSPQPTNAPSSNFPSTIGSSDKWFLLDQYYGTLDGEEATNWTLGVDTWTLPFDAPPEMYAERYILAMLFFSTTGNLGWSDQTGWLDSSLSVCEWAGIVCNRNFRVMEINLVSNGLSGALPWQLGRLEFLSRLFVDHNPLRSSFTSNQLSTMSLVHISMRNATLTGTIPSSIRWGLPRLSFLDLAQNYLSGVIPTELPLLTHLRHLDLSDNQLSGTIPSEILVLTSLQYLNLVDNNLIGTIPYDLPSIRQLEELHLDRNDLVGTIPTTISYLERLTVFSAGNNVLFGRLPDSMFIDMSSLRRLDLAYNRLSGTISPLIEISQLEELELQNNLLTGEIPPLPESLKLCNLSFNFLETNGDTGICEV